MYLLPQPSTAFPFTPLLCVFLVAGETFAGKDTLYAKLFRMIAGCYGNGVRVRRMAFADALKKEYADTTTLCKDQQGDRNLLFQQLMSDREVKETHRHALIELAMNRRAENVNFWAEIVVKKIRDRILNPEAINSVPEVIVITDFRFLNEYQLLNEFLWLNHGIPVYTVRVNANGLARMNRGWCPERCGHRLNSQEETLAVMCDFVVENSGEMVSDMNCEPLFSAVNKRVELYNMARNLIVSAASKKDE